MRERGQKKTRIGVVTSNSADKTIAVEVTRRVKHPKYMKYVTRKKRFHVHDEANECGVGDTVRIIESRPLSKTKRWRVVETLNKVPQV